MCVDECDADYFISYDELNCVRLCSSYEEVDGKRKCNENCEQSEFVKISGEAFTCETTCEGKGYVSAGRLCVKATCEALSNESKDLSYGKYIYTDGSKCLTKCPSERKYFDENKNCLNKCESTFATADLQCTDECPKKYTTNSDGMNVCQDECKSNQYVDGKNCSNVHCADRGDGFKNVFA